MKRIWEREMRELTDPVNGLPEQARLIYRQTRHQALERYGNEAFANQQAWAAVGQAGYRQDEASGEWQMF